MTSVCWFKWPPELISAQRWLKRLTYFVQMTSQTIILQKGSRGGALIKIFTRLIESS